jgi:hypothetical protein
MSGWVAGAVVGSAVIGSVASSKAGKTQAAATGQAADMQAQVAREQLALQERMYEEDVKRQQPWLQAGEQALNRLTPLATQYTPFGMQQFQQDPGYQFRMSEGMKALERGAAARGGLLSGATLRGTQRFGQELASQEYQNAFNRYQAERTARLQPLQSLAGVGQTTAQQLGQAGQNFATGSANISGQMATNVGNMMTSGAAARASGYVGQANALTGALGTGLNFYQNQQLLNRLTPQSAVG